MSRRRVLPVLVCGFCLLSIPARAWGLAGTIQVAQKGQKTSVSATQPAGVEAFLNDPARGDGFNDFFSEWPNDVNQYQYHVESMAQLNELLRKFSAINSDNLQIRLCPMKEPKGFGWVSKFEDGNGTPVIFTIGDQERINHWYAGLRGNKFGVMEFTACPEAIPPTLTIFVGHDVINLDELRIPGKLKVSAGYVPAGFQTSNIKPIKKNTSAPSPAGQPVTDPVLLKATNQIKEFLEQRKARSAD